MKDFKTKEFGIYYIRWIISALVMLPFMILFEYLQIDLWLNLFLGQSIGSVIFFKVDKWIFTNARSNRSKTINAN